MEKFKCWDAENGTEEDFVAFSSIGAQWAAQDYAEYDFSECDGWEVPIEHPRTVHVRDASGKLTKWKVTGEDTVEWYAREDE